MGRPGIIRPLLSAIAAWGCCTYALAAGVPIKSSAPMAPSPLVDLFREHIASAKAHDPQYRFALESAEAQERGVQYAESLLWPKISLNANSYQTDRTELSTNFLGAKTERENRFNSSILTIQARQSLYKPRDVLGVRQSESQKRLADTNVKIAYQDLLQRLIMGWFDVFYTQDLRKVSLESLEATREILSEAQKRFSAGDITLQEVEVARSRVATAEALVHESELQNQTAREAVRKIIGPQASLLFGVGSIYGVSLINVDGISLLEKKDELQSKNLDIAAAREKVEARRYEREKVSAEYRPVIEAFVSSSRGQNDSVSFIKDENRVGVQLTVPIYTFGTIASAVAQADALYRAERTRLRDTELQSRFELSKAYSDLAGLKKRVEGLDAEQQALSISLAAQLKGLVAGVNSRAEVARTVQDRASVARQALLARRQLIAAWTDLLVLGGEFENEKAEEVIGYILQ